MDHLSTILMSLDLLHVPSRVRMMRSVPLPDGTVTLLRIASGDDEITRQAALATGSSPKTVREAAGFFIEQTMLHPEADSYRVLGVGREASTSDLRRNMALLVRWLHPDHGSSDRSVLAHRVTRAWNDLKTEDRRAAYDRSRRTALADKSLARKKGTPGPRPMPSRRPGTMSPNGMQPRHALRTPQPSGLLRRVLLLLLGREVH